LYSVPVGGLHMSWVQPFTSVLSGKVPVAQPVAPQPELCTHVRCNVPL